MHDANQAAAFYSQIIKQAEHNY